MIGQLDKNGSAKEKSLNNVGPLVNWMFSPTLIIVYHIKKCAIREAISTGSSACDMTKNVIKVDHSTSKSPLYKLVNPWKIQDLLSMAKSKEDMEIP